MATVEGRADPFPLLERLHDNGQLVAMPDGYLAVYGYQACDEVLRSPRFGRQPPDAGSRVVWPVDLTDDQRARLRAADTEDLGMWLQLIDPPDQSRLRRLVTKAFTPGRIERMRTSIEHHFARLVDGIEPGQPVEFVHQIAFPVPSAVIGEMIGLPVEDRSWFARHAAAQRFDKDPHAGFEGLLAAAEGRRAIAEYIGALLEERRRSPRDDLASALVAAEADGDRLSHLELVALTSMLYIAAYGTTADFLGNAMLTLLDHPDQLRLLRTDPGAMRQANEEVLRYTPVVMSLDYWSKEETELAGIPVAADTPLHVFLAAANRDPTVFAEPDRFDIRRDGPASLSFGAGAHYCLGAALARMEGEIALTQLLQRFGSWRLSEPPPERVDYFNYRSHHSIHVTFER